jgi:SnoaL-like domain
MNRCPIFTVLALLAGFGAPPANTSSSLTPEDQAEIYQLYHAYAEALDTHDGAALSAMFTPDGTITSYRSGKKPEPVSAMAARVSSGGPEKVPMSEHMVSMVYLKQTASGANGSCYGLDNVSPAQDGQFTGIPEFYSDNLVKTHAGWRFKNRRVVTAGEDY